MYRLLSCAERVPPTWLALGLDQSLSSLLPAWYQFWSFRAAPPSQLRRGRRTDLSPESSVPGHNLVYQLPSDRRGLLVRDGEALEPFRKVASHHEAVMVPCRGDRVGTGDVHRQAFHRNPDDVLVQRLPLSPSFLQHCTVTFVADPAHVRTHSGPVETLFRQRQGACRAQMGPDHPSMEPLEKTAASICRDDQLGPPSLSLQLVEPSV